MATTRDSLFTSQFMLRSVFYGNVSDLMVYAYHLSNITDVSKKVMMRYQVYQKEKNVNIWNFDSSVTAVS